MRRPHRTAAGLFLACSLLLPLTACSSDRNDTTGDTIAIGIKYDQPGLGLQEGKDYTGFDVRVATYVAGELGYPADRITFKQTPSAQREAMLAAGQVKMIFATYSITDARKEKVSFAGPYFVAGQDLLVQPNSTITSVDDLQGRKLCSVAGSTSAKKIAEKVPGIDLASLDTYSKCVTALAAGNVDAVTTDNIILAGFASQPQYRGKVQLVGKPFTTERYGVGIKKGDVALCQKVDAALTKMVKTGAWAKALDESVGPAGFRYDRKTNPPTFDSCS